MLKSSIKKYLTIHYEKFNNYLLIFIGFVSIVFSLTYIYGIITDKWLFNFVNTLIFVVLVPLLITIPFFGLIIILSIWHYWKSRELYYKIIKQHRQKIKFFLLQEKEDNAPTLLCTYNNNNFRMKYSRDRKLMITLLVKMGRNLNYKKMLEFDKVLLDNKIKNKHFGGHGLTLELKRPLSKKNIANIPNNFDDLLKDILLIKT